MPLAHVITKEEWDAEEKVNVIHRPTPLTLTIVGKVSGLFVTHGKGPNFDVEPGDVVAENATHAWLIEGGRDAAFALYSEVTDAGSPDNG